MLGWLALKESCWKIRGSKPGAGINFRVGGISILALMLWKTVFDRDYFLLKMTGITRSSYQKERFVVVIIFFISIPPFWLGLWLFWRPFALPVRTFFPPSSRT